MYPHFYADIVHMGMFFCASKRRVFGILCFILFGYVYAQTAVSSEADSSDKKISDEKKSVNGIWENKERFVKFNDAVFSENADPEANKTVQAQIVLKPFYRYYYDGIYSAGAELTDMPLAVFNDGIYTEFWTSHKVSGGTFWRPENNRNDFTIENVPIARELAGYYTSDDLKNVYKIRYWITKADFTEEKAELRIPANSSSEPADNSIPDTDFADVILIDKYIKIGKTVYTCATGRRTYIRNPEKLAALPETARVSDILVFGDPLLKRSAVTDLQAEIDAHNSIVYPPHFSVVRFVEPSIYKKLETMGIDDFYNIRAR